MAKWRFRDVAKKFEPKLGPFMGQVLEKGKKENMRLEKLQGALERVVVSARVGNKQNPVGERAMSWDPRFILI